MNNTIKNVLIFSLGAAAGSLVAWRVTKTKYEQYAQDEIDAYKAYVKNKNNEKPTEDTVVENVEETGTPVDAVESLVPKDILDAYRSGDYKKEDYKTVKEPYVISPEEYGTLDGYECVSLTHYADGVLTDDHDNVIENPDDIVGDDYASHFGEYEDDSVFIRNEDERRDYEILRDLNAFADYMANVDYPDSEE